MKSYIDKVAVRLVREGSIEYGAPVSCAKDAQKALSEYVKDFDREAFGILCLDTSGKPLNVHFASVGTLDCSLVNIREIFKAAILSNAASIIAFHNHPAGSDKFSKEDLQTYRRIQKAGNLIGITMLDGIVIAGRSGKIASLLEQGMLT